MRRKADTGLRFRHYPVAIRRARETIEATMSTIKEAITAHLMALQEEQDAIPIEEELVIGRVKVDVASVGSAT